MYELLKLQAEAWKENNPNGKNWDFEWEGFKGWVTIRINNKGKNTASGIFFTDKKGIEAACRFITENLNKK